MLRRKPDLEPRHVELAELVEPRRSLDIDRRPPTGDVRDFDRDSSRATVATTG